MNEAGSNIPLVSFCIYLAFVFLLAGLANRKQKGRSFVNEYFLGSRNIGLWAFALTYAATAASGGSFMGFPSLIYTHGWSLAWWICGYMVVPLVALGLFAKRINQVSRLAGAITVPELMRNRFGSPVVGNTATLLVVFFMFFYLLAQFKAGAAIMATLLEDVPVYQRAVGGVDAATRGIPWIGAADADYLLCLLIFAVTVIIYTAYGGFRAVVWTDVMQGIVMGAGVVVLLILTLSQVGGLGQATRELARMTPPEFGTATVSTDGDRGLPKGAWVRTEAGEVLRLKDPVRAGAGEQSPPVEILRITTPGEIEKLLPQCLPGVTATLLETTPYAYGADQPGVYVTAPGPSSKSPVGFLTVFLAMSFFAFWNFSGAAQPSYMVRQMAFNNTVTLRRSIVLVAVYFSLIYFPLVIIFTCARVLLPGLEIHPDRAMPEMAAHVTTAAGMPWLAGLLIAAPFAAVMSSVDSFLLLVSSGVVRDVYQQSIRPDASDRTLRNLSYAVTVVVGFLAMLAVLNPPRFLQDLIVFASGGLGASFLMPIVLSLYWPRMTATGALAGMLSGAATVLLLYLTGFLLTGRFGEYNLLGVHPFIWSILVTTIVIVGLSLAQPKPPEDLVRRYFGD